MMKDFFLTYAKYNRDADQAAVSLVSALSPEEREKDRGSYFKSLSGLVRHLLEGTLYFGSLFKPALGHNGGALKALAPLEGISIPPNPLTEGQWKTLAAAFEPADTGMINLIASLTDADFKAQVKVPWFKGNPEAVSLYFLLESMTVHQTHHRGQISQILDELKIDHTYSSIKLEFLG